MTLLLIVVSLLCPVFVFFSVSQFFKHLVDESSVLVTYGWLLLALSAQAGMFFALFKMVVSR